MHLSPEINLRKRRKLTFLKLIYLKLFENIGSHYRFINVYFLLQ